MGCLKMVRVLYWVLTVFCGGCGILLFMLLGYRQDTPPLINSIALEKRIIEVEDNLSGLTWDAFTQSLLAVTNNPEAIYQLDREGNVLTALSLPELNDTESISIGWGETFLIAEERKRQITAVGLSLQQEGKYQILPESLTFDLGGKTNEGLEGIAFSQSNGTLYVANEKNPAAVFKIKGFNHSGTSLSIEKIYSSVKDISGLAWCDKRQRLYVLSDEAKTLTEMDSQGIVLRASDLSYFVQTIPQPEGVAVEGDKLYVVSEPNYFYVFNMADE